MGKVGTRGGSSMRAVKNKHIKVCACSAIPNPYSKNKKRRRKKTAEDWRNIRNFNDTLEKFCIVNKKGECEEPTSSGSHSLTGIYSTKECEYCESNIWEFIKHAPIPDSERRETIHSRPENVIRHLPIPELSIPSPLDIQEDNALIEEQESSYDDGWGRYL